MQPSNRRIPGPSGSLSPLPDKETKSGLHDYTGKDAHSRVLLINLWLFKYGTNDKTHAAAVVLSLILLTTIIVVIIIGMNATNGPWLDKVFSWLGGAFLFIAGVALGKGGTEGGRGRASDSEE